MWIRLKRSHTLEGTGKKLPIGRVFNVLKSIGSELIRRGIAEAYDGNLPPPKMKTDFFKSKK